MQELNEAYSVLGDPRKRLHYDSIHPHWRVNAQTSTSPFTVNTVPSIKLQPFFIQSRSTFLLLLAIVLFVMLTANLLAWQLATPSIGFENAVILSLCFDAFVLKRILAYWQLFTVSESEFKCPKCSKLWAAEILREKLLGIFKKYVQAGRSGRKVHGVWYEKYKVQCKCKYCGHAWIFTKSIKQSYFG